MKPKCRVLVSQGSSVYFRSLHFFPQLRDGHVTLLQILHNFFYYLNESSCCHESLREHNLRGVKWQVRSIVISHIHNKKSHDNIRWGAGRERGTNIFKVSGNTN